MHPNKNVQAISGVHHITAIASSAAGNLRFYTEVLGLRLVKKTVNFDDPHTYHFYYGDAAGSPGTILTFFPWEKLPPGRPGAGAVASVAFAVADAALGYWRSRLTDRGIAVEESKRFGRPLLKFKDPHGLTLELIATDRPPAVSHWEGAAIPSELSIQGLQAPTAVVRKLQPTADLLQKVMGMQTLATEENRTRFKMADPAAGGNTYDVVEDPSAESAFEGGGSVHHIAFRAESDAAQALWRQRVADAGFAVTPVIDRTYFRSIYFRESGGVLFEIATDPPGFGVDESPEALGSALQLPARYAGRRKEIEARLPALAN